MGARGAKPPAQPPLAVVRPANAAETAQVLRLAGEAGVAVIAYGAGTGLMGGARSLTAGIVLDTARLDSISVSPGDRMVWAGAGAVLADVDRALAPHDLCLGHDPWTYPVATVGGALSTNGLGYRGGRYGGIGDQALALEVALADGSIVRTRAVRRAATAPDLARLFVGAQGTLGVITAAALEAFRAPERRELRGFTFESFESGFAVIDAIAALSLRPSLLDYGEEHASPWPDLIAREDEPPVLYLGFEGAAEEVDAVTRRAEALVSEHGGRPEPRKAVERFWEQRHIVAQRFARGPRGQRRAARSPDIAFDYLHVALPPSQVLDFRRFCHEETSRAGVGLLECGLWTAPDFFSCVLTLPARLGGHERLSAVMDTLLREVQARGGSMEYVHGAGLRLAHLMPEELGEGLRLLRRIKRALDPAGILNPGKLGL